ncbi:daf-12-interacting protein 1 isoform X2 [Diabrotica virgifera virgifera]|uniref:DUF4211 domain-containing protein n=1 Tax=Diabrotica virgifera virgifera TaxID=50390 RepID=A0ABM5K954_DIAVI|nr:daf-12-interacting protein 1 isoform X2 [Diabrotica virgifera virgifera]
MDPVGPWYATPYNRLASVQAAGSGSGELHHHLATTTAGGAPPTTTAQLLPGSFLSPHPVGYETVFSPLFHHASAKPAAHYVSQVTQQRAQALAQAAATKQSGDGEFHPQTQAFFEQGAANAWQQSSPFGILPHESVVATTTSKTYENFNAHFAAAQAQSINNHLNSQIAKAGNNRAQSPQVSTPSTKTNASQGNPSSFFQVPSSISDNSSNTSKTFSSANTSNIQQSCIVSSPSTTVAKEYRVPQAPARTTFLTSPNASRTTIEKAFASPPSKQQASPVQQQIQTKAQTKIYSELGNQQERQRPSNEETQSQSSPISFSIMDAPGRLNYTGSNSSGKRPPQFPHNYRHYQQQQQPQGSSNSEEFQRPKSGSDYNNSNGPDCNVVVPRRPSPLQAHSQASPLGHAQSPAYPMYNSPMNSISSPQQSSSNQVAPPSPLDVSVPRPSSQTSNVAYPSVITRALNHEKSFPERYERPNHNNQQTQNCWDERQGQRKFQNNQSGSQSSTNYSPNNNIEMNRSESNQQQQQQQQRVVLGVAERQQTYFDSNSGHQVTLQDLSSCRGDPMSIVKNLQQQQQSCQVQQTEIKTEPKPPKRRKSSDKPIADMHPLPSRIPPPAHSSATNQPQQNGAYFDFDRWNLPPPTSKFLTTQSLHQQHQGLMVPHPHGHHPPPPLPYFAPFHLPPHPTEYSSTVELTPLTNYNEQSPQASNQYQPQPEEHPKVVVPNIEEELNFLSQDSTRVPNNQHQHIPPQKPPLAMNSNKPPEKPPGAGSGFMSSYLKFLQGERDTSPPPAMRGAHRKQTWPRAPMKGMEDKSPDSNGVPSASSNPPPPVPVTVPPLPTPRLSSQGDPQDDPRYFPLPKERKRNSFDSSDDGFSSDDDFFGKKHKQKPAPTNSEVKDKEKEKEKEKKKEEKTKIHKPHSDKPKKPRTDKPPKPEKERKHKDKKDKEKKKDKDSLEDLPRRESTKRVAKKKNSLAEVGGKDDEPEEPPEFQDSDSDPAWTPAANNDEEEGAVAVKKNRRGRPLGSKSKKTLKNLISAAAQGAGIGEGDDYSSDHSHKKKLLKIKQPQQPQQQNMAPTLEDNIAASLQNSIPSANDDEPFKSNKLREKQHQAGEFVVIKSELNEEWPAIWRVDGKTLLQKYEPFEQNGVTLYRNISTYTSWTPESKKQYMVVPVKYRSQGQLETIVEFLKHEMNIVDFEYQDQCMKQFESYQDNFEVYIQTLISQALDSNFLMEIFHEKDDYFLSNVQTIDDITDSKKQKFFNLLRWPSNVQAAICTWPCYNVLREVSVSDSQSKSCAACNRIGVSVRVLMYGQPYNSTTLEGCPPDPNAINEKDFLMCRLCVTQVELLNKVTHQKYLMYIECAKRVSEKRTNDATKDTTCILNELLADESWLNQLFLEVRTSWAEIDSIDYSFRTKNSVHSQ